MYESASYRYRDKAKRHKVNAKKKGCSNFFTLEMLDFLDLGVLGVLVVFGSFGRKSAISGGGNGRCC